MTPDNGVQELQYEQARLEDLGRYALTFDEPEPAFTSAVDLLCHICKTPFGGISVVDSDTVWLKARHGVELSCVARSVSFCTIAIASGQDLFIVPDTEQDPRFQAHPLVRAAPFVRYYAAVPLFSQAGFAIGTLWVMDLEPDALDKTGVDALRMVASHVTTLLDTHYLSGNLRLYNRAGFLRQMRDRLTRPEREPLFVGCVNLRGLRHINDTYGHEAGNRAVEEVARHIRAWRDETTGWQGGAPVIAYLDSGNFALALSGPDVRAKMGQLVDSLRRCEIRLENQRVPAVTTVSLVDGSGERPTAAPALLDKAALIAREAPNSGICVLHDESTPAGGLQETLARDLGAALAGKPGGGTLEVWFQPIFDIEQTRLAGFEGLLRWDHPTLGSIPPERFLPVGERMGASYQLDLFAFTSACRALATWREAGFAPPPVSVNLSRATLSARDLGVVLTGIAEEHGIAPGMIELEITAAGVIDPRSLVERVTTLRALGFSIAIDDFGSGMSNLDALRELPCDTLKINRPFIDGVADAPKTAELCRLMIGAAGALGVRLICIGAEREEDAQWLAGQSVRFTQGWYFAEAVPEEAALRLIRRARPDGGPTPSRNASLLRGWAKEDAQFSGPATRSQTRSEFSSRITSEITAPDASR